MSQEIKYLKFFIGDLLEDLLENHQMIKSILTEIKEFFLIPSKLITKKMIEAEERNRILKEQKL